MRVPVRRLAPILLISAFLVGVAPASVRAVETGATDATLAAAEQDALDLVNRHRANRDLVKMRLDKRLREIARDRAAYMARTGRFSHTQEGGRDVFDILSDSSIKWYLGGEIIAWNTASAPATSATYAVRAWMASSPHKAIIISKSFNYAGFGMAISPDTGRRYWAGVFIKGPDRTGAWSKVGKVSKSALSSTESKVVLRWSGADTRLQTLTAGFRYFQIQRRVDGGAWYSYGTTTRTSLTRYWTRGRTWEFRVRARDRAGNWGSWRTTTVIP
jgi:uncharacterized protein YkwD